MSWGGDQRPLRVTVRFNAEEMELLKAAAPESHAQGYGSGRSAGVATFIRDAAVQAARAAAQAARARALAARNPRGSK